MIKYIRSDQNVEMYQNSLYSLSYGNYIIAWFILELGSIDDGCS